MTTTIQQLGQQAAFMEKASSTALVRAIQKGLLSPSSIRRAARHMKPETFRKIEHLGSGQYNTADLILGNVGSHAGLGVRKLPVDRFLNPKQVYTGLDHEVDRLNKLLPTGSGVPAIAPYYSIGDRGAFQHLADYFRPKGNKFGNLAHYDKRFPAPNIRTWYHPDKKWRRSKGPFQAEGRDLITHRIHPDAREYMADLHGDNMGVGGQIYDFQSKRRPWVGSTTLYPNVERIFDAAMPAGWSKDTAIHKWYDGMTQAQRANAPGYTPTLDPRRQAILDAKAGYPKSLFENLEYGDSRRERRYVD